MRAHSPYRSIERPIGSSWAEYFIRPNGVEDISSFVAALGAAGLFVNIEEVWNGLDVSSAQAPTCQPIL
jgi:hypothetical protein